MIVSLAATIGADAASCHDAGSGGNTMRNAGSAHKAYATSGPKARRTGARSSSASTISTVDAISVSMPQLIKTGPMKPGAINTEALMP